MPEQQRAGYRNPAAPEAVAQDGQAPQRARGRIGGQQVVAQLRLAVRQEDQRLLSPQNSLLCEQDIQGC